MIDKVNEFKFTEFSYASYINKVNEILIRLSDDDEIYEDPWLKLNKLYNINALFLDEFLDKIWKLATVRIRKADKKINIDKYLEIDKYVDEYTDITDGKIDLFNNLGSILTKAVVEIQNKAYIINDLKQKENLDIKTLKTMHETLEKVLIKWMKTISSTIKNDKFSKYDMKPARPSNEKDVKPARKSNRKTKKSKKRDTDKDNKPDTNKDIKPDTDKDIKPNKKILLKIIQNNIRILNRINTYLSKSLKNAYLDKNKELFDRLCSSNKCNINPFFKILVSSIYAVNVSIESL